MKISQLPCLARKLGAKSLFDASSEFGNGFFDGQPQDQDNDLVRILPSKSVLRTYWIVYHESLRDIPRVRAVLDFMIGLVEESRADFLLGAE